MGISTTGRLPDTSIFPVSIPNRDLWEFQRLLRPRYPRRPVSIPNRDLWEFQPRQAVYDRINALVSIPNRDLWEFQLPQSLAVGSDESFQSLIGIYGNFNQLKLFRRFSSTSFNP